MRYGDNTTRHVKPVVTPLGSETPAADFVVLSEGDKAFEGQRFWSLCTPQGQRITLIEDADGFRLRGK